MIPWAKRLKEALTEKGWSIRVLSEKSGVEYNSVTKYLKGKVKKPRGNTMQALADTLDVSLEWLEHGRTGASDRGAQWESEDAERYVEPVYYQDWSGDLAPKRFQRFAVPLIEDLLGETASKGLRADFFKRETDDCLKWLEAARYDAPDTPLTEHLAQYLVLMLVRLGRAKKAERDHRLWWLAARQTARLMAAGPR